MRILSSILLAVALSILPQGTRAAETAGSKLAVVNMVRFYPVQGHEKDMVGGRFYGSNVSLKDGFVLLGEIEDVPAAGTWSTMPLRNTTVYRWVKYVAPAGSHGRVAKLAFCDGTRRLMGQGFGSFPDGWRRVLDASEPAPKVFFQNEAADGGYIGLDLGEAATGPWPQLQPGGGREYPGPVTVTLTSKTPGIIRYTMDGTIPTTESEVYSSPIKIEKTSTISAVLFREGKAPTRSADATYIIGHAIDHPTFHTGNSLTGITGRYPFQEFSAGYRNDRKSYGLGGGLTKALWNAAFLPIGDSSNKDQWLRLYGLPYSAEQIQKTITEWKTLWPTVTKIEDYTIQPRDFDIAEEADYDNQFLNLVFQKAPEAQPWLYIEWTEQDRHRPTDLGKEPTTEMTKVWPAGTWEESMAAMILYGEDLKRKVNETYKGTKPLRIIPAAIAVGWIHHMIENGEVPGIGKDEFYPALFSDQVHLNMNGAYLVDCIWYAAFHKESPEGKFLPLGTTVSAPEARIMQRLAWNVVKNYPDSGLYEEGTTPCGEPKIVAAGTAKKGMTPVALSSFTPGAWFRYTMDGTTPTRTRGYVYCGAISARPGMTIKAIAYESGMADSPVTSANFQ